MDIQHAPYVLKEVKRFLSLNMYESADQLANLFLSAIVHRSSTDVDDGNSSPLPGLSGHHHQQKLGGKDSPNASIVCELYELIADIAYQRKETRRALNYYRLTIQHRKYLSSQSSTHSNLLNSPSLPASSSISSHHPHHNNSNNNNNNNHNTNTNNGNSSSFRSQVSIVMNEHDAKLRYKECKCQADLKETAAALKDLEAIPPKYRDLAILTLMAQLYNESNLKRHAISAYKEALLLSPLSIEILQQLIQLNCDFNEIMEVLQECMKQQPDLIPILTTEKWLQTLLLSFIQKKHYDTEKSYTNLLALNLLYPKNSLILSLIALNAIDAEQIENAIASFKRIRQLDHTIIEYMDTFGRLLFLKKEELELNRLANEIIELHPTKPQGYLIASWYCLLKNDFDHASSFVEKALMLNPKYPETFKVKGRQLYHLKNYESALIAFSQANSMQKDLHSFVGVIESNISLGKFKDAANAAREMVLLYQKSAEVYYVMGTVLAKSPQGAGESIRAYGKALRIQPRLKKAAIALSATLLELNRPEESLECLKSILSKVSDPKLRLLLARTFVALGKYHEALEQLQICISLQPTKTDPEASKEIEKIENILKGENSGTFQEEYEEVVEEEEEDTSHLPDGRFCRLQKQQNSAISGPASSVIRSRTLRREDFEEEEDDSIHPDRASHLMNEHIAHGNNLFSRQMNEFSGGMFLDDEEEEEEEEES